MYFNATFKNISVTSRQSVLLVAGHSQTLLHNVVSSRPRHERDLNSQP